MTMRTKKSIYVVSALLMIGAITFYSCKKDETVTTTPEISATELNSTQDEAVATASFDDVMAEVDDALSSNMKSVDANDCRNVKEISGTITGLSKKFEIDFGTGCFGKSGRTKSGKILVDVSGRYWIKGWTRTITFSDFKVNGRRMEGTKTVTYMGLDANKHPYWTVKLVGGKITYNDSTFVLREFDHVRTLVATIDTTAKKVDGAIEVTGSGSGTNRKGSKFTDRITIPLVFSNNCKHIKSGAIEITVEGKDPITITYENENCSGKASISRKGKKKEIDLD